MQDLNASAVLVSVMEKGGLAACLLICMTICVVLLYRFCVGPMLVVVHEIFTAWQGGMSDLKQATANTKDVAALNVQVTADLRQSITRLETIESNHGDRKHG
jgi:hypothetical protein